MMAKQLLLDYLTGCLGESHIYSYIYLTDYAS